MRFRGHKKPTSFISVMWLRGVQQSWLLLMRSAGLICKLHSSSAGFRSGKSEGWPVTTPVINNLQLLAWPHEAGQWRLSRRSNAPPTSWWYLTAFRVLSANRWRSARSSLTIADPPSRDRCRQQKSHRGVCRLFRVCCTCSVWTCFHLWAHRRPTAVVDLPVLVFWTELCCEHRIRCSYSIKSEVLMSCSAL